MKQLRRSGKNQMLAGVAGGLAEYFELDVALVRLVWVLAVFFGGAGILAYIILWIVLPQEKTAEDNTGEITVWPEDSEEARANRSRSQRNAGILLVAVGLIFLTAQFVPHWMISRSWPLLLVLVGLYLLFKQQKGNK